MEEEVDEKFFGQTWWTTEPIWRLPARELAEAVRQILQRGHVNVGAHYYEFSIEELPGRRVCHRLPISPRE
jgi:hypothetical protein